MLLVVPVEQLMGDLPLTVYFEQAEHIRSMRIGASQFARPPLNLEMDDGDTLNDLNACKSGIDVRSWAIFCDPLKHVFNRAAVFNTLAVTGDGR